MSSQSEVVIEVGETHVTVRKGSGSVETACILERTTNAKGRTESILLDRRIHERYEKYAGWEASGCYVTELTPKKSPYSYGQDDED